MTMESPADDTTTAQPEMSSAAHVQQEQAETPVAPAPVAAPAESEQATSASSTVTDTLKDVVASTSQALIGPESKVQIVDEHQDFATDMDAFIKAWELYDRGFAYDVVAVFGSQSTGKSTLLNRLFGTKFDVMDEAERKQTTKGIWMSKGEDMDVLVMDVEGTDGRERGEDQDFERKSALFSMAVTEVLIVNIWEHQVGLYQGANMGLLKTVFEVNLGLFLAAKQKGKIGETSQDKTLLLFVIRDHIGATPLANLERTLTADLNRLWDGLSKPTGMERCQITDFFDLGFVTLPHKLLQPEVFEQEVKTLRTRFTDASAEGYVFQPKYHKRIPADGVSQYMKTIWEAVVSNKDLDLPTQQELLAQFRCDEIADVALAEFADKIKTLPASEGPGKPVVGLGPAMESLRSAALAHFDTAAGRYHAGVYDRKRLELLKKLNVALSSLFMTQLKNLHKSILREYRKAIQDGLKGEGYDFAAVVKSTRAKAEEDFVKGAREVVLADSGWSYDESLAQLQEDVVTIADMLRVEETKKMVAVIERNIKRQTAETVELSLGKPSPDMWDKVLSSFKGALAKGESSYLSKASSFNCTDDENETALAALRKKSWLALRAKIDEQTADAVLLVRLKLAFEDRFRYDADGVPRVWKPEDDIDVVFRHAREHTLSLVPLYSKIKPLEPANEFELPSSLDPNDLESPEFDFLSSLTVLSDTKADEIASRFRREADAYYLEAKRSMISSISQVPYWMYGVLAVLGWNEFIAVLSSPVYFTMLLIGITGAYILYQLNLMGAFLQIVQTVGREVVRTGNEQLHLYFSQPPQAQPVRARPDVDDERDESKKDK